MLTGSLSVGRVLGYVGLTLLGALAGIAGALVQAGWFPLGLLLALGGSAGLFWAGALLTGTRVGAAAPAGGWSVTVLVLTLPRPEGDFVFATGAGSYVFLFGGMLLAAVSATMAPSSRPPFTVADRG